jgi:hypothetical protein
VVGQALSKDPRERFSSPVALMRAVQRAVGVEAPIPGPSAPKRQETPRAAKRESPAPARRPAGETKEAPATPPAKPKSEAAPAPSREADEASHAARSRAANPFRRARRGDQGNRRREGGRSAVRRLAPTWAGIALVASALAGFATGNGDADDSKPRATANTVPAGQASRPASEPTKPVVGPVVERLDERRAAARRRMRAARRPAGQKAAAGDLAEIYRDARRSILNAPGEATSEGRLADHMLSVERAYRSLASAAREGPREWQRASDVVLERERDLELLLRTRSWI